MGGRIEKEQERLKQGLCVTGCGGRLHTIGEVQLQWCRKHTEEQLRRDLPGMLAAAFKEGTGEGD